MITGIEWLIDATGCRPESLRDSALLAKLCEQVMDDLSLCSIGPGIWHTFPGPGGVTGFYMLTESHLTCHTYPEWRVATFNLYCCRERPSWAWSEALERQLGANHVRVRKLDRGERAARMPNDERSLAALSGRPSNERASS